MTETPSLPEDPAQPKVWLYDAGAWQQVDDPVPLREDGDVLAELADAGYRQHGTRHQGEPHLEVLYPANGIVRGQEESGLRMWVRQEHPQCVIQIEWNMGIQTVYAARFPDGLDLMAKWAPIFHYFADSTSL